MSDKSTTAIELLGKALEELILKQKELTKIYKTVIKEDKTKNKKLMKVEKHKEQARKKPSGCCDVSELSNEMCDFLKVPYGTKMSRGDVVKAVHSYIKSNKLQNPVNGRIIQPDDTLKKLLKVQDGEEINYFKNIQKRLNPHIAPFKSI